MGQWTQALRQLVLRPALSMTVIAMLATGVGTTTAIYSMMYRAVLQTVPVPDAHELVSLRSPGLKPGSVRGDLAVGGDMQQLFSYPMYRKLAAEQSVFTGLAAHYAFLASVDTGGEDTPPLTNAVLVSGNYFSVLDLRPAQGRFIDARDARYPEESLVAVLSYRYWQDQFAGDPNVLGKTVMINNQPLRIIGVAPDGFTGTMRNWTPLVYVPLTLRWLMQPEEPYNAENPQAYWLNLFARLRPGVSLKEAEFHMNALYRGILSDEAPNLIDVAERTRYLRGVVELDPGSRGQVYTPVQLTNPLTLALGATVLVLLIVCVNIANLLLLRGASRAGEMAIRASVGASRTRLVVQLLVESTVLAVIGGVLSIPIALVMLRILSAMAGGVLSMQADLLLEWSVLTFAGGVTVGTVVLFGLVPALSMGHADPAAVMKAQSAQSAGGRDAALFRSALVALQVSLSLVLLVLAGLFTKSLVNVVRIDYGMDVDSLVAFSVTPLLSGYSGDRLDALYERVRAQVAAQPGVESVAHVAFPMFYGFNYKVGVTVVGVEQYASNSVVQANPMVSPRFFETTGVPLIAGRDFTDADSIPFPNVAIVNESFVRRWGLGDNAIGTRLRLDGQYVPASSLEIVGVVGDAKYVAIKDGVAAQVFTPRPPGDAKFVALFYYVRAADDTDALARMIPAVMDRIDPNVPVSNLTTVRDFVDSNTRLDQFMAVLSAIFAGLATVLAAIGLYAVIAFSVAQRKRELGLRLALGAEPKRLRALVLLSVARLAAIGGGIGCVGALAAGRVAQSLLYGLSAYDPVVLASAVGALAVVVLVASWVPALRASNVAPMEALRYE